MASGVETFTGTNGAALPSPWITKADYGSSTGGSVTIQSNTARTRSPNLAYRRQTATFGTTVFGTIDLRVKITLHSPTREQYPALGIRMSGANDGWETSFGDVDNGYTCWIDTLGGEVGFAVQTNGSNPEEIFATYATAGGETHWLRIQAIGSAIKVMAWEDGDPVPSTWLIEETDSTWEDGWIGFAGQAQQSSTDALFDDFTWDDLAGTVVEGTASGVLSLAGTAAGHVTRHGQGTGTIALAAPATGHVTRHGTATGALSLTGPAVGHRTTHGQATGALTLAGPAAGHRTVQGQATGVLSLAAPAAGHRTVYGAATGTLTLAGPAIGSVSGVVEGTATGVLSMSGPAVGHVTRHGAGTGALTVTGSAAGHRTVYGTGTGALNLAGPATGSISGVVEGTATGALELTGTATGHVTRYGSATGVLSLTGPAVGHRATTGSATGALALAGPASGHVTRYGAGTGSLALVGPATGVRIVLGSATGALSLAAPAAGHRTVHGTGTGLLTLAGPAIVDVIPPLDPTRRTVARWDQATLLARWDPAARATTLEVTA